VLLSCATGGLAICFVPFLDQVFAIADRITVLRNGERVGEYLTTGAAAAGAGGSDDRSRTRYDQRRRAPCCNDRSTGRKAAAARDGQLPAVASCSRTDPHFAAA